MAVFSNMKRPLETSLTTKDRRIVGYVNGVHGCVLLEFAWMEDDSLIAAAKLIRRVPGQRTSKVMAVDYAFFPTVDRFSRPSVPCRLACFERDSDVDVHPAASAPRRTLHSLHDALQYHLETLETECTGNIVLTMLRNRARRGSPPQWTIATSPSMRFAIGLAPESYRQNIMLKHLVIVRSAQSKSLLCNPNKLFACGHSSVTREDSSVIVHSQLNNCALIATRDITMNGHMRTYDCAVEMERLSDIDSASSEEGLKIDAPFIGCNPDLAYGRHGEGLNDVPIGNISDSLINPAIDDHLNANAVAWCVDCQAYTTLPLLTLPDADGSWTRVAYPKCTDCGSAFSKRAMQSRYWREEDILAASDAVPRGSSSVSENFGNSMDSESSNLTGEALRV